jgi:hypothetical protein
MVLNYFQVKKLACHEQAKCLDPAKIYIQVIVNPSPWARSGVDYPGKINQHSLIPAPEYFS